jgi:hypothetical protein
MATRKRTQAAVPERRGQTLVLGGVFLLGTGLGVGFFAGQFFPRPLDPAPTMTAAVPPAPTEGVDTPIPSEVYSFYRMFDEQAPTGSLPVVPELPPEPAATAAMDGSALAAVDDDIAPAAAEASGVEEGFAVEVGDNAIPLSPDEALSAAVDPPAPAVEAGDEERRTASQALVENERPEVARPPAEPESSTLASSAAGQGGTESRVVRRTVQRARTPDAEADAPSVMGSAAATVTTRVVRDGQSRDAAESQAASLRSVGLTASTSEAGDGTWQVLIRVNGNESEVRRQTSLAARRLASQ